MQCCNLAPHISAIAERVAPAQRICFRSSGRNWFAPRTVSVFYHEITGYVNDSDDVALQVMNIVVFHAVILYKRRSRLRIIEEMQLFCALSAAFIHSSLGRMGNQFTVESRIAKYSFVESAPFARGCLPRAQKLLVPSISVESHPPDLHSRRSSSDRCIYYDAMH